MLAHARPRSIVYLGSTLALRRARELLPGADYRPPVRRGDLPIKHDGTVVIIDGDFHQSLAVSPKEILRLLDQGTRVIGASSMGALRAAELNVYGMQGCGWVFEAYRSGRIIADDEVAVTYSPDDFVCLTIPLVNIRRWLEYLDMSGQVDARTTRRLVAGARRVFYADRSHKRLLQEWERIIPAAEIRRLLIATGGGIIDVKAADAEVALTQAESVTGSHLREDNDA